MYFALLTSFFKENIEKHIDGGLCRHILEVNVNDLMQIEFNLPIRFTKRNVKLHF